MEETEMNQINQIRERFLADTQQYFFANDTQAGMNCCTDRASTCHASGNEAHPRPACI